MVNVPGRSKGCNTCRKRKIACSQQRPACSQCLKSGRQCLGYSRKTIFVNSVVSPEPRETQGTSKNASPISNSSDDSTKSTQLTVVEQREKPDNLRNSLLELANTQQLDHQSNAVWSLCNASARSQLLGELASQDMQLSGTEPNLRWWMGLVPQISFPTKALETAAYAVSTARLGGRFNDEGIMQESLKLYTQGLKRLQQALWDPDLMYHDETLAACMFLAIYEVLQCPAGSRAAFVNHHQGCAKLVKLRGPEAHTSGFGRLLFLGFRFIGTLHALESKETFLSEPEWRTIPFSNFTKTSLDKLLDIILYAPSIIRKVDVMNTTTSPATQLRVAIDLLQSCFELEERLERFHAELEESEPQPMYWPVASFESSSIEDHESKPNDFIVFECAFQFPDQHTAVTLVLYWGTLTMLQSAMCHMYRVTAELATLSPGATGDLIGYFAPSEDGTREAFRIPPPGRCKEFAEPARYVCQSVEWFLQSTSDSAGLMPALQMVRDTMRGFPGRFDRELAWIGAQIQKIEKRGVRILKYIF